MLTACAWLGTRFAAIDFQTGTPLAITLDQGMAIFVTGEAPLDLSVEITGHDPDQVAWQWWFASYPYSLLVPLWVPLLVLGTLGAALTRPRVPESPGVNAADKLIAAIGQTPP
jgi:hypothetical protein